LSSIPFFRATESVLKVVRETIATLGSSYGLVACKPFALQYANWMDEANKATRKQPGFEEKRLATSVKSSSSGRTWDFADYQTLTSTRSPLNWFNNQRQAETCDLVTFQ
jgi:hypothetical protein